jgi:hypothetical protein
VLASIRPVLTTLVLGSAVARVAPVAEVEALVGQAKADLATAEQKLK